MHEAASEETSSLQVPDAGQLVEQVLQLVASESAALLAGHAAPRDERLAALNVRTALATWDVLHLPEQALRLLELADGHPLALRLRTMAALDDAAQLERLTLELPGAAGPALRLELAEAWLWRHGAAARAGELADQVARGPGRHTRGLARPRERAGDRGLRRGRRLARTSSRCAAPRSAPARLPARSPPRPR